MTRGLIRRLRSFERCLSNPMSFRGTDCLIFLVLAMCQQSPLFAQSASPANQSHRPMVRVPFVGCASDGQVGPLKAPKGTSKVLPISPEMALRLPYYKAYQAPAILAPPGTHFLGPLRSNS